MRNLIIFISGLCVGAGATYALLREKMEAEKQAEIDELKEYYRNKDEREEEATTDKLTNDIDDEVTLKTAMQKPSIDEYRDLIKKTKYSTSSTPENDEIIREKLKMKASELDLSEPYVIPLVRFEEDFKCKIKETIHYYEEDGVLADEADQVLPLEETIGEEALEHFGDETDGVVYVRNEKAGIDYEVILSHSSFERYKQMTDDTYEEDDDE